MRVRTLWLVLVVSAQALAEGPSNEAKALFAHGLEAFERGDALAAREDFERVAAEYRRPGVVYNLALVYGVLGDSARAVTLLDEVFASPGTLSATRLAKAHQVHAEHLARLGELTVVVPVDGADVRVDGRPVGRTPLGRSVRVKAGDVMVDAAAPKHAPARRAIAVEAGTRAEVHLELMPLERALAQLTVRSSTPEVELLVDGVLVARAPFFTSIALEAGERDLELRREGFRSAHQRVTLAEGGTGAWQADLEEDPVVVQRRGGTLRAKAGPGALELTVDGRRRGALTEVSLVPGPHEVRFERGGFFAETRSVDIRSLGVTEVEVHFQPTPELRATLEKDQGFYRSLGWAAMGGGVAVGAAGGAYLAYNLAGVAALDERIVLLTGQRNAPGGSSECLQAGNCDQLIEAATSERDRARGFTAIGVTGVAVGVIAMGVGFWALLRAPDPAQYDRPRSGVLFDELALVPVSGGSVLMAGGRF